MSEEGFFDDNAEEEKLTNESEELQRNEDKAEVLQELVKQKVKGQGQSVIEIDDDEGEIEEDNKVEQIPEEKVKPTKKNQQPQSDIDNIVDMKPMNTLLPTKTESSRGINDRIYLLQNYIGSIKMSTFAQDDKTYSTIDVEFADKGFHAPFKIDNDKTFEMAAMNVRGMVLASKGPNNRELGDDGYAKDDEVQDTSKIYFQSFQQQNKFLIDLPNSEGAEAVTIGNDWLAVATDTGTIRVLNFAGTEIYSFQLMRPLVSLVAYEQLLVVAYLDSVPMFGCQMIKARVYDLDVRRLIDEIELCLSLYSDLEWMGFSEDGLLITSDTKDVIWGYLFDEKRWVQINHGYPNDKKFWIFSANEYSLIGYLVEKDDRFPDASQTSILPEVREFQICTVGGQNQIALKEFIQAHETFRYNKFGYLNESRLRKTDPLLKYSQSIWDSEKFKENEKEISRLKLRYIIKDLYENQEFEKLLEYFKTSVNTQHLINAVVSFIEKNANMKLIERIKILQQEKLKKLLQPSALEPNETLNKDTNQSVSFGLGRNLPKHTLKPILTRNDSRNENRADVSHERKEMVIEKPKEDHVTHKDILIESQVKYEDVKKSLPFASKIESQSGPNIFDHIEQSQMDNQNKKRKLNSQFSFGQSTLNTKKNN